MNIDQIKASLYFSGEVSLYRYEKDSEPLTVAFTKTSRDGLVDERASCDHVSFIEAKRDVTHIDRGSVTATLNSLGYKLVCQEIETFTV